MVRKREKTRLLMFKKVLGGSPDESEYGCKSNEIVSCSVTHILKQEAKVIHTTI